jgi:excisionase family DNA binding protein
METLAEQRGLLTGPCLARLLGHDRKTVYRMAKAGRIPHMRLGGRIRFNPQAVAMWLSDSQMEVKYCAPLMTSSAWHSPAQRSKRGCCSISGNSRMTTRNCLSNWPGWCDPGLKQTIVLPQCVRLLSGCGGTFTYT